MRRIKRTPQHHPQWRQRFWWFDVVYPVTLAALLFWFLTSIVYSGSPSSRLSLMAENKLLEFSEHLSAGRKARYPESLLVVTADALEVAKLGRSPAAYGPDAAVSVYVNVLTALLNAGVRTIFVEWNPLAHPNNDAYYAAWAPLFIHAKSLGVKIYLMTDINQRMPQVLADATALLDGFSCIEGDALQSYCTYNSAWQDWTFVRLIEELKPRSKDAQRLDTLLTVNLPTSSPGLILNLSNDLQYCSFSETLSGGCAKKFPHVKLAFVGTNFSGSESKMNTTPKSITPVYKFVRTVYDDPKIDVLTLGTPKHQFWAMVAQMFIDEKAIHPLSPWYHRSVTVLYCAFILVLTLATSGSLAIGLFVFTALGAPIFNAWCMRQFNLYVPLADSYYFGLLTFVIAGSCRLSLVAFRRWFLQEAQKLYTTTADLKSNFISLLSHNLNTPVAKMQGLLTILVPQADEPTTRAALKLIERKIAQLEYAIRTVLVASTLEEADQEHAKRQTSINLKTLLTEFKQGMLPSLKRYGVSVDMQLQATPGDEPEQLEEMEYLPLRVDTRAFHAGLAACFALFGGDTEQTPLRVGLQASFPETTRDDTEPSDTGLGHSGVQLHITIRSARAISATALSVLNRADIPSIRSLGKEDFTLEVLAGLVRLLAKTYDGEVKLAGQEQQTLFLCLRLPSALDGAVFA